MSEMHVAHTNHLSRMQSLFESCRGSSVTKPFLVTVQSTICSAVLTHDIFKRGITINGINFKNHLFWLFLYSDITKTV